MNDPSTLHEAIIKAAEGFDPGHPALVGYHWANLTESAAGAIVLVTLVVMRRRRRRQEPRNGGRARVLTEAACSVVSMTGAAMLILAGFLAAMPSQGSPATGTEARDSACSGMLNAIRAGEVRWMPEP